MNIASNKDTYRRLLRAALLALVSLVGLSGARYVQDPGTAAVAAASNASASVAAEVITLKGRFL
jgi:hypothetical protein